MWAGCTEINPAANPVMPSEGMIQARVEAGEARLASSEAGQLIQEAITAHGGLETWYANGPLSFEFDYRPNNRIPIHTYQTVDIWGSRAVHRVLPDDSVHVQFGWDGTHAWQQPAGAPLPVNGRFWALTPYYFLGIPFVLADEGVILSLEEDIELEDKTYRQVRVSFEPGTGDSPDDYYIIAIDPETNRVRGIRYIVTYPGLFPNGGHFPERLMMRHAEKEYQGILFPDSLHTYTMLDGKPLDLVTRTDIREIQYQPALVDSFFYPPANAQLLQGL